MSVRVQDHRRIPFFMVGKPDLALLAQTCDSRMLPYARSIYFALLELANDQRSDEIAASRGELAQRSGVSVATLKRCAPALRDAGLVTMREVSGYPNVWTLLSAEGGGSDRAGSGGSDRAGGRVQQSRGVGLTEPGLKETVQEGKNEEVESPTDSRASNDLDQVWEHYQESLPNGKRCRLNAARRLLIEKALKVRSVEECKLAITALSRSDYHVQNGYLDLKYALLGGGRSPTPEATIDRLIAQMHNGHANGNGNGTGVLKRQTYSGGRTWDELTRREQENAKESFLMGYKPWDRSEEEARLIVPSGHAVTGATFLNGD